MGRDVELFQLLQILNPKLNPDNAKIHLASHKSVDNPLDVYFNGGFEEWQSWQSRRNFERDYVISLIALPSTDQWLFVGVYKSLACEWIEEDGGYQYQLNPLDSYDEIVGRVVVSFTRPGRQSYLNAENWADQFKLNEIKAERLTIAEFPGFKEINISKSELDVIVNQSLESWRTALSSVAGVYLISDTESGKLYVGSATGEGGIWQRWSGYSVTGHGGNKELVALMKEFGSESITGFRFTVLEIADTHASEKDVLARETHWKKVLLSREFGFNAN